MVGPNERREPRRYVPPPWEDGGEGGRGEAPAEQAPQAEAGPAEQTPPAETAAGAPTETPAGDAAEGLPADGPPAQQEGQPVDPETAARMESMLQHLSIEEQQDGASVNTRRLGTIVAIFVAFIGAVLTTWAVVVFAQTREAGFVAVTGSCLVGFMGLMMLGAAAWVVVRAYKRQGA